MFKVIINQGLDEDLIALNLTDGQTRLLNWLLDNGFVNDDEISIEFIEDATFKEI